MILSKGWLGGGGPGYCWEGMGKNPSASSSTPPFQVRGIWVLGDEGAPRREHATHCRNPSLSSLVLCFPGVDFLVRLCFILGDCCGNEVGTVETLSNRIGHSVYRADLRLVSATDVTYHLGAKVLRQYTVQTQLSLAHMDGPPITHTLKLPRPPKTYYQGTLAHNRHNHQEHHKTSKDTNMNMIQGLGMTSAACQAWLNRK